MLYKSKKTGEIYEAETPKKQMLATGKQTVTETERVKIADEIPAKYDDGVLVLEAIPAQFEEQIIDVETDFMDWVEDEPLSESELTEYEQKKNEKHNQLIYAQIDQIDKKRIRALVEGGVNPNTGTEYIEEYTNIIKSLRAQIR